MARKIKYFFFKNEEDLFLYNEEPHLEHTIFPPKDLSETKEVLPQFKQNLFTLINKRFLRILF